MKGDVRTLDRIRFHYEVERSLSDQLRHAPASERGKLYHSLYNELFTRVTDHEQFQMKSNEEATERETALQLGRIKPLLRKSDIYCEIGAGDCALAIKVSKYVKKAYAIDVSEIISDNVKFPENLEFILSDGISIPIPENTVDLAYSNQLMEHLHPEDSISQLNNIYKILKPGGKYVCITPNRLSGPHDISRYFDDVATGFHLKEYTNYDLKDVFAKAGFRKFRAILSWQHLVVPWLMPLAPFIPIERALENLPRTPRRRASAALGAIKFVAIK
ncbi:SAM-dependent methyltransferase [Microvirga flocculans]|uniref:SAM-dependent methyltransferase n=1 Tax=Microvirga flocculans TaxID=217168 RepID=A0A7W6N8J8_9HYPH|nr:class I SAM-dependent methyltransferase [Microvirga flocculans]MBB4040726.1 SAM-dependent methyltransferase [Microvirga flocculans]